jgi:hypothetical protein
VEYRPIADAEVFREPLRIIGNCPSSDDLRQFAGFRKGGSEELYRIAFRKKIYGSIADLQVDLDRWVQSYNEERPHQGRWCFGKTPMQTFLDATPLAKEKMIAA